MFSLSVAFVLLILLVVGVTIMAVKIGGIALRLTGLDEARANFQALSAVTGTGFTTRESELIMLDPQRRRIISTLMVFGNAVLVSVISLLVGAFTSRQDWFDIPVQVVLLAIGLVLFAILLHLRGLTRPVKAWLNRRVEASMRVRERLVCEVLALEEGHGVAEVRVHPGAEFAGKTLAESGLRQRGMMVLAIRRGEEVYPSPGPNDRIMPEDRLVCYGELARMHALAGETSAADL